VLKEKYDIAPQLVPVNASLEIALGKADAALLVGDASVAWQGRINKIDLVDEWMDLTGLPFVHGIWAAREDALSAGEIDMIVESGRKGSSSIGREYDGDRQLYLQDFRYELDDEIIQGLTEFFRMAYYHGILKDIPEIRFHGEESPDQPVPDA
jgi:chorismate dehydratase